METKQFTYDYLSIPAPVYIATCITKYDLENIVFLTGGIDDINTDFLDIVLILNLTTLQTARQGHGCESDPNNKYIYVIRGRGLPISPETYLDSVERLDISDINNIDPQNWEYTDNLL